MSSQFALAWYIWMPNEVDYWWIRLKNLYYGY